MDTIADLDIRLEVERAAFLVSVEDGDIKAADVHYKRLDALLDRRIHCPLTAIPSQRQP